MTGIRIIDGDLWIDRFKETTVSDLPYHWPDGIENLDVLEIGFGLGTLARLSLSRNPNRYVILEKYAKVLELSGKKLDLAKAEVHVGEFPGYTKPWDQNQFDRIFVDIAPLTYDQFRECVRLIRNKGAFYVRK